MSHSFIFPGQGSQSIGMLSELANTSSLVEQTFAEASDVVHYDVWQFIQADPEAKLNETAYTQVAMLTADVAVFKVIQHEFDFKPHSMAGHSLGEYAALVCSQALPFADAVYAVQQRGQLMQSHIPLGLGAMAAIVGLEDTAVEELCEKVSQPHDKVMPANYNALGQVVVAGHHNAVKRLIEAAERAGARLARLIPVSVPCHCSLLKDMATEFAQVLAQLPLSQPQCNVLSNVNAQPYADVSEIRSLLEIQLYKPVQWVKTIQNMATLGAVSFIECGPGQVLSGLIKRIDKTLSTLSVNDGSGMEKLRASSEGKKS